MQRRVAAAFIAGVLFCVLMLGAGVGAFYALSNDAQAQGEGTWQITTEGTFTSISDFRAWVITMPAECDIEVYAPQVSDGRNLIVPYYRCPDA